MLKQAFIPIPEQTKMKEVRNFKKVREDFLKKPSNNLKYLLENRYLWMNRYICEDAQGIEIGSGTGISKCFIKAKSFLLTDKANNDWLDIKNVDALDTRLKDNSYDFVVISNTLHHLASPIKFLKEMHRILKPHGKLILLEPNASLMFRIFLRITQHEGYSFDPDVFNEAELLTDPDNTWSANCAIANLLFDNKIKFNKNIDYFRIIHDSYHEFMIFLNSGGVNSKIFYIPLPITGLKILHFIDSLLIRILPGLFACIRHVVLEKIRV